jgi:ubiquinone/menaquinone biosynthesis C-methylase UbiE
MTDKRVEETARRYDEIAPAYRVDWRGRLDFGQRQYLDRLSQMIGPPPGNVLDVGSGTGKNALYLASLGYNVSGLDVSEGMLRQSMKDEPPFNYSACQSDMRRTPFPSGFFDSILSVSSLVHLDPSSREEAFKEFRRVLKPDGILHIGVQNLLHRKRFGRIAKSHFYEMDLEEDSISHTPRDFSEVIKFWNLIGNLVRGYAHLDRRHWFYPSIYGLQTSLRKQGFEVLEHNNPFSKRVRLYAKKI